MKPLLKLKFPLLKTKLGLAFLFCALFGLLPGQTRSQCLSKPFPDQWTVHELESTELPYRSVYIYADFDIDGDGRKDIVTGGWWYKNPGSTSGNWIKNTIGENFGNVAHVHDFDGDGDLDLLGTTLGTAPNDEYESAKLLWARNDGGDVSFQWTQQAEHRCAFRGYYRQTFNKWTGRR